MRERSDTGPTSPTTSITWLPVVRSIDFVVDDTLQCQVVDLQQPELQRPVAGGLASGRGLPRDGLITARKTGMTLAAKHRSWRGLSGAHVPRRVPRRMQGFRADHGGRPYRGANALTFCSRVYWSGLHARSSP
jgi:hypothetical protein